MPNLISLLSARRVINLQAKGQALADKHFLGNVDEFDAFISSGAPVVPFAVQHMKPSAVAEAMQRVSIPVGQVCVEDLVDVTRTQAETIGAIKDGVREVYWKSEFELVFGDEMIGTQFYPRSVRRLLCFERGATGVLEINRGLVITDSFVENLSAILDELGKLNESPLDHVLITLRMMQGYGLDQPLLRFINRPEVKKREFIDRDHFTEKARAVLDGKVRAAFEQMEEAGGDPLSFRVFTKRINDKGKPPIYNLDILWNQPG